MSVFNDLKTIKCKVEKKGKYNYVSWAEAWKLVKEKYPGASFKIYERQTVKDGIIYNSGIFHFPISKEESSGAFVKVGVTIDKQEYVEVYPILNSYNKPINLKILNAFDINTSIKRALVKALAFHGLGLYIYEGEDLPMIDEIKKETK